MKHFTVFLCCMVFGGWLNAQTIPSVDVKTMDGKTFNTSSISNDGKPIIVSFWATWCKPCVKELIAISENYSDWQKETGVKLYAVAIDDSKSMSRVAPLVNSKGWEYEILLDPNSDFKRAMNVVNVPHTFLIDGTGKIVDQHTTFADGDEAILYEKVKKVAEGKPLNE
jgi:cytochrome c biogenesis protein CcmG, thiol:disulfide interchange protein DsbE